MVSKQDMEENKTEVQNPIVLSQGASVALGNVFKRINKSRASGPASKSTGKRPRPSLSTVVLTANEEVREALNSKKKEEKRYRDARKAKLQFESNGRVIPDAATNAAMEKAFLMTATKGTVALFNAVSKAQKTVGEATDKPKKGGPPISRDSFMSMMKAGVAKGNTAPKHGGVDEVSDPDENLAAPKSKAKWLKDDFLTAKSKTLRDWDREGPEGCKMDPTSDKGQGTDSSGTDERDSSESDDEE